MNKEEIEVWKDIQGYEGLYQISNLGRVKSLKFGKERIMKQTINTWGYPSLTLYDKNKCKTHTIHKLVAQAFIPNPQNLFQINHKDENKQNNNVSNLEWCTQKYNINYGTRNERISKPIIQFSKDGKFIKEWQSITQASKELNINCPHICDCCNGKRNFCGGFKWMYMEENKKVS